jgi:hypothetical protein
LTRFLDAAAVRVHAREFLDETDVTVPGLEIDRSKRKLPGRRYRLITTLTAG